MPHEPVSVSDKKLLQRVQNNELDALEIIHHRYFAPLYKYALYRVNDPMTAEDITSEVFARLLEVIQSAKKKPRSLRRWLYGVAHNVVVDYHRCQQPNSTVELDEEQPLLSHDTNNPVKILEDNMQKAALETALTIITEEQREVIALRFGAELSVKTTALVMDKSINAVKVLQFRALKSLKAQLEPWK